ncbi:MAG: 3'(2'),5'-bisphosphate nucleotidase [Chloroflexi bacterium]|nr:3'(2'),5'-bisphosphate nucleotidase [Chloroflexota bacterium]
MNLEPIKAAVRQAAALCGNVQQRHIVAQQKGGDGPVTIADYGAQALICAAIQAHFPGDCVLAEESGRQFMELVAAEQRAEVVGLIGEAMGREVTEAEVVAWLDYGQSHDAPRKWVIDPVDGTKGFLALRHYAIAVGLVVEGQPVAGVMGCPGYPEIEGGALFWAQDGSCWLEPISGGTSRQVRASTVTDPAASRVLESVEKSHAGFDRMARARELAGLAAAPLVRIDSMEKYARIAAGDAELYLRLPNIKSNRPHSTWDHAAGAALVAAGGGKATDVDGTPLDFASGATMARTRGMVVTNGLIHDQVLAGVQALFNEEQQGQ